MRKKYLCRKVIRGRERWFVRFRVGTREKYPEIKAEPGTPEFDRRYWEIMSGAFKPDPPRTSWLTLIQEYRASQKYKRLKPRTKRTYELMFERILEKNADKDVRATTRKAVRALHAAYSETPAQADRLVIVIRLLLNFARVELEWIDRNVAEGIELTGPKERTRAWPSAAQSAFVSACIEMGEYDALTLYQIGAGTGQRAGDCLKMKWEHYDGEFISVVQDKTETRLEVCCPARLRAYLDGLERRGVYIIARDLRRPKSYSQIHKAVMRIRKHAGLLAYRIHGWRATAAVELREAGNDHEAIAAITGHKDLSMVRHYTLDVDQRAMSKQAQEKRK